MVSARLSREILRGDESRRDHTVVTATSCALCRQPIPADADYCGKCGAVIRHPDRASSAPRWEAVTEVELSGLAVIPVLVLALVLVLGLVV
jgi:hypothetical protein